jgi:tRNA(fMet)-specific endonuclease VapC
MIAFDTDVLVKILRGNPAIVERASSISSDEQSISIVVVEEIVRARLNAIRQAEAGNLRITVPRAYDLFERSLQELRHFTVLPFTSDAESIFDEFRSRRIRVATHDLRIAAISIAHRVKLISRNRRDFDRVPGLDVEYWP